MSFEEARAATERVLADPLYWFPVRHHSPNVARHLRDAMRARRPRLVLLEGPAHANHLVQHVVHAKTRPPVAIYASYVDDGDVLGLAGVSTPSAEVKARFSSWYPLLPYSPEYVAMKTAREIRAEVVFIDLPFHALLRPEAPARAPEPTETHIVGSGFFRELATAAGYRTFDEAWDALFEVSSRHADFEAFRHDLASFCAGARFTSDPASHAEDGTLERERFMKRAIAQALAERGLGPKDAMVVCGGFHLFLDHDDPTPPPTPPEGTVHVTVAPFSYLRTSKLVGYAAGNRAPRYYQTLWEQLARGKGAEDAMVEHVCNALRVGRRAGEPLSSADAVSIAQHARMLAALRGRPAPVLDDIEDAIVTCCCKGDPEDDGRHLLQALRDAATGNAIGRVTPDVGQLPLVWDFHANVQQLQLEEAVDRDAPLALDLDRREPLGARRSAFLHRLTALGVPLAELRRDGGTGALFKESWRLRWSPRLEDALVERNLYGDTVEAAALTLLEELLAAEAGLAGATARRWRSALDMDLPALAVRLELTCGRAIDTDPRLASLAEAFGHLRVLQQHAGFQGVRQDVLADLQLRCFRRACLAIPDAASVPDEEHDEVLGALMALAEAVQGDSEAHDRDLLAVNVRAAAQATTSPFLRGAFLGLLTEIREAPPEDLAEAIAAHARGRPETLLEAGPFVDGVIATSRTSLMLGAGALIGAVDELLAAADWESFTLLLPRLRHAFERLHRRQRANLAERVAERYGLKDARALREINTSVDAAVALTAIDQRAAAILEEWDL